MRVVGCPYLIRRPLFRPNRLLPRAAKAMTDSDQAETSSFAASVEGTRRARSETAPAGFRCYICGEGSEEICVRCTRDSCGNHLCEKCRRCSDCCACKESPI